jgi:hypothetical protein
MTTPAVVFKKFARKDLLHIIKYRGLESATKLAEESDKALIKMLAEDVSAHGLQILMQSLDKELLKKLATHCAVEYPGYDEDVKPSVKLMAKRLVVSMAESNGAKHWLTNTVDAFLGEIAADLELEGISGKDKEKAAKAILAEADAFGVENCLSAFSVDLLIQFAEGSGLRVYGHSREKILEALENVTSMEKPKKRAAPKKEKPSEVKPKIKKGISTVDLNSWYYGTELADYCKEQKLPHTGAKKDLIKRILDHLDGKAPPEKKVGKRGRKPKAKTSSPKKKATGTKRKATQPAEEAKGNKKQKTSS